MKVLYTSTDTGVDKAVGRILDSFPWREFLPEGRPVLVKVNLTWDYLRPGVNTSPWVVEALCRRLKEHTGQIYLGESSQILVDASKALRVQRMDAVVERQGLIWHNFSDNPWKEVTVNGLTFGIPDICTKMPVISVPVVKTHYRSVISVALKHLYGCLNDGRHNYHYRLSDYVVAVNKAIPVKFILADGTVSLEGSGPKPGIPKQTDFLALSTDPVALDHSVAKVMGLDPGKIDSIQKGNGEVGTCADVENVCISPLTEVPSFNFKPAEPNFVAKVEKKLRGKKKEKEIPGDGPFIGVMKAGAKRWYNLSYSIFGQKREAEEWKKSLPYGPQWLGEPEEK
ncbi:MAG: DUF362 domain-containing protein [Candidatus Sabulitectum sp.]|nr:DUF362 domain-containing protein [Candidatus Sabulitectum sp.]